MLVPNLPLILASLHLLALTFTAPITTSVSPLALRSAHLANAPSTLAEPILPRLPLHHLPPRFTTTTTSTTAPNTQTSITLTLTSPLLPTLAFSLTTMLQNAHTFILAFIAAHGDGVIANGFFNYMGDHGLELNVRNANNHQTTYGVLGAACVAVLKAMLQTGVVGEGLFAIFDGGREVGWGRVG